MLCRWVVFCVEPSDEAGECMDGDIIEECEALVCFQHLTRDHSVQRGGTFGYQGGMYVEGFTADNEGVGFGAKDAESPSACMITGLEE